MWYFQWPATLTEASFQSTHLPSARFSFSLTFLGQTWWYLGFADILVLGITSDGDYMECKGSNLGRLHAEQETSPLYLIDDPEMVYTAEYLLHQSEQTENFVVFVVVFVMLDSRVLVFGLNSYL